MIDHEFLAVAELYMTFATFVRKFESELHGSTKRNVIFVRDFETPYPEKSNFRFHVKIEGICID
jgi:hypothetical protein